VPPDTNRLGRAMLWLAVVITFAGGVLGAIAGNWPGVVLAAAIITPAATLLVAGRTHTRP
jgi:hypothetical protein